MEYLPRIYDKVLERKLDSKGAVLIEGPKWCGKSSTAKQRAKSILDLSDYNTLQEARQVAQLSPRTLLEGKEPRLVDEWQEIPRLWDVTRNEVDRRQDVGQFIFTGSAVPPNRDEILHTGTGRFSRMTMRPMSLWESRESSGQISLHSLFEGTQETGGESKAELVDIAQMVCRGGWPMSLFMKRESAMQQAVDYFDAVVNFDVSRVDGVRRSPELTARLLRSYARHVGLQSAFTTIRDDVSNNAASVDISTLSSYLTALKSIFVIEEMASWNPNLRSKTAIRTTETRYFTDPSIACAALGIGPGDLMRDLKTFGMMFENMCVRDLRVYAEALDGKVYHYRDSNGLECDSVVHLRNGKFALVEIKLGGEDLIEAGVKSLTKLAKKLDPESMNAPSFMMIITAVGKYAYKREDGIWIVPITTLKD